MPTRKIKDLPVQQFCRHPEHNPPSMMVYSPGVYEHACPSCGRTITFTVSPPVHMSASDAGSQLSKLGASKGGIARAEALTPEQRTTISRKAAQTRWKKEAEE